MAFNGRTEDDFVRQGPESSVLIINSKQTIPRWAEEMLSKKERLLGCRSISGEKYWLK